MATQRWFAMKTMKKMTVLEKNGLEMLVRIVGNVGREITPCASGIERYSRIMSVYSLLMFLLVVQ